MGGLSNKEWLVIGGIVIVIIYLASRKSSTPISGANVYGLTGKTPVTPEQTLAIANANEQSASRQDSFNLAKLNIASNLIKDSMAYQNQKDLIDKVSASDLALLQQQQAGQRQQSLLQALGNLLGGLGGLGGASSGRSSSGGSGGASGGGSSPGGGGFTPPFMKRNTGSIFNAPVFPSNTYNSGYVLDNSWFNSFQAPDWSGYSGYSFDPIPPNSTPSGNYLPTSTYGAGYALDTSWFNLLGGPPNGEGNITFVDENGLPLYSDNGGW